MTNLGENRECVVVLFCVFSFSGYILLQRMIMMIACVGESSCCMFLIFGMSLKACLASFRYDLQLHPSEQHNT